MNAPPFPTNPSVGQSFGGWTWNGVRWVCSSTTGIQVLCTVFTSSGPYMPSPGLVSCVVECIGGGGGGGAAQVGNLTPPGSYALSGGGGGSGGYSRKTLPAALVAGGVSVTIGAGGPQSGVGTATSFGALCVANGGGAGELNDAGGAGNWGYGGQGASPGVGDVAFPGAAGDVGGVQYFASPLFLAYPGAMGGHMFGGSQGAYVASGGWDPGKDGQPNTGAGGSGAVINQAPSATEGGGGNGGSGICIVTEYCWADADTGDCVNPPVNVNARVAVTHVPWQGPGPCPPGWGGQIDYDGGE